MQPLYPDLADFLNRRLGPGKYQKLPVEAGTGCPNRDGTLGYGGCIYCSNMAFHPTLLRSAKSVTEQLRDASAFMSRKYPSMRYLAYFQTYTGTYGNEDKLLDLYNEALAFPGVCGLVIGTRPDCVSDTLLDRLANTGRFVMIEYGAETACETTLKLINRCHTWDDVADAARRTAMRSIAVGLHLIFGLPGETSGIMLDTIRQVNKLPVDVVKFHQLQVLRGTRLHQMIENGQISVPELSAAQYAKLCADAICMLRDDIAIDRLVSQSPPEMLVSPRWGLKRDQMAAMVNAELLRRQLRN